jgi:DNA mismatch repair protein MSH3
MVEVGYRYKFFGDDAKVVLLLCSYVLYVNEEQVAAQELGMVCFRDRNFLVASIPTFRREIYLRKYVYNETTLTITLRMF